MCTLDATTVNLIFDGKEIMSTARLQEREFGRRYEARRYQARMGSLQPDPTIVQDVATLVAEGLDDDPPFVNMCSTCIAAFRGNALSAKTFQFMIDLLPKRMQSSVSVVLGGAVTSVDPVVLLGAMRGPG